MLHPDQAIAIAADRRRQLRAEADARRIVRRARAAALAARARAVRLESRAGPADGPPRGLARPAPGPVPSARGSGAPTDRASDAA